MTMHQWHRGFYRVPLGEKMLDTDACTDCGMTWLKARTEKHGHSCSGRLKSAAEKKALEAEIFAFLQHKYVQRADDRQKAMGLVYTEAETHDLAKEMTVFLVNSGKVQF